MILALLLAALLPVRLDPPPPFPTILTQAPAIVDVAPGVEYGTYDIESSDGPIAVHAIAVAAHAPSIRLDSVLAGDTLTSAGETISAMARRTGAIAGINADYFDIGNTNRPTNILVRSGALLHTPRKRYALIVTNDGTPEIAESTFAGTVTIGGHSLSLDGLNELPPPGGATALVTPVFGSLSPQANVTLVQLAPESGTPPFCSYRVTGVADNTVRQPPGYYLAIGLNAYASAGVPDDGTSVVASGDLSPVPLANVDAAVGGGPLLLDGGTPVDDPDGPSGAEFALRIPSSGAGITAGGTLLLIEVDGREPDHSIGLRRPEFASLMRAFGAQRAMAFDGGGSSELVARTPTQLDAVLQNQPSDGRERSVSDGIFVYDDAPAGAPAQIVAAPSGIHALQGARVRIHAALADSNDRVVAGSDPVSVRVEPASLGTVAGGTFIADQPGNGSIVIRSGPFERAIAVHVESEPARLQILPHAPAVATGGTVLVRARAFDASGYALSLPPSLPWRALHATIASDGTLTAGSQDALVTLFLDGRSATSDVSVGFHDLALTAAAPHVMTVPRDGDAAVDSGVPCPSCVELRYALGPQERAAYIVLETPLPAHSVAIAFELFDATGNAGRLKLALRNAINEEVLLPAATLGKPGWRHVEVRLPAELAQPARLTAIYVIGTGAQQASGTIAIRNIDAVVAGTAPARR